MSTYRVKTGSDVALNSLTVLSPQPRSTGIQAVRRTIAASGAVYDEGAYVELVWSMVPDATTYQTLLTTFGLSSATTAAVTVYVRDYDYQWVRKNGTAVRPEQGRDVEWDNYFVRGLTILVKDLTTAAT